MPEDPVITWGAEVLAKGFEVSGDVRSGIKGTVPYLISWFHAFDFANAILGPVEAVTVGPMTFHVPYRLKTAEVPCYAQRYKVQPCGADGSLPTTYKGLRPGEFFTHAIVTVEFEQVNFTWDGLADDPYGLNQLDPANPITLCEQSVKIGGKMRSVKGKWYRYSDDNKPVDEDVSIPEVEARLVLRFPRVQYLPWQLLIPFVGKVNSDPMLGCGPETLLLEAPDTTAKLTLNGPTPIEQSVQLEFAYNPHGWNKAYKPNGLLVSVYVAGDPTRGPLEKIDHRTIFNSLSYAEATG